MTILYLDLSLSAVSVVRHPLPALLDIDASSPGSETLVLGQSDKTDMEKKSQILSDRVGSHVVFVCMFFSNTLFGHSDRMFVDLSIFLIDPQKIITIFQPTFPPVKRYQDMLFKLHTLSTNSVTKKIIVVPTVYLYNSG